MKVPHSLQSQYPPLPLPPTRERPLHVVVACTGSVASVKVPALVEHLIDCGNVHVHVVATSAAMHFFDRRALEALDGDGVHYSVHDLASANATGGAAGDCRRAPRVRLWTDAEEWSAFSKIGDPVLHIEVCRY